ncbi:type II CAAX endopeptidase family protein [Microbacterium thalassium]|uniref:Membrane protease YdiL (CAAX protease family) n=1 Tax=Microbacterium thalassium TaxID=362649 RepID=A0A7X0KT52_9MICO|nr:type II CAAX endopeptidase family protein [Microbacterium thalassium]MBB6389717.1 membrane protease YdiL (CAAX protease family) [Microbacterium thalassium]GLK24768.1 CPBP family intramembrane metalloprotease [Microbacterium thalassium]
MTASAPRPVPVRHVVWFFVLAFVISWLAWLPTVLDSTGMLDLPDPVGILGIVGPFGPFIAALVMVRRSRGRGAIMALLKRGWSLDFDKRWLVPTILLAPAMAAVTVGVMALTGQQVAWEYGLSAVAIVPMALFILVMNAAPEEYGWRGYALEPMMSRLGALGASLVLGAVWGLWHLPLHFIAGTVQENIPIYQFILQQMVLAVFYTWLFANTRGAVSIAILFHTIANVVGAAVPTWTTEQGRWTGFLVQLAFAVVIVLVWGPRRLSRRRETGGEAASAEPSAPSPAA